MEGRTLFGRIERRHVALVCLVALVALAGCAGGTGDSTTTETPVTTATPSDTVDGPDGNGTSLPTEASIDNYSAGDGLDGEVTPAEDLSVDSERVVGDALTAIMGIESYRLTGDSTIRTRTNNVDQLQELQRVTRVERGRPALSVNSTVQTQGRTIVQEDYYVDGTLYRYSPLLVQQYNSEWIKQNISGNFSQLLSDADRLSLYRNVMENGTATLEGAQTVDDERTYRVRVNTDGTVAAGVLGLGDTNGSDAALVTTFWVDANDSTIVRADGAVEVITTQRGQTAVVSGTFVESLTYGGVTVTLPEAASTAVGVDGSTTAS
jgi:hypothetical protein